MMFLCWVDAIVLSDCCSDAWNATVARNVEERVGTDFEYRRRVVGSEPRAAELALDDVRPAAGRTGRYRSGGHGRFPSRGRRSTTVIRSTMTA